jgi:hypothetical protein
MIATDKAAQTPMDISAERLLKTFEGLENGDGAAFVQHASERKCNAKYNN